MNAELENILMLLHMFFFKFCNTSAIKIKIQVSQVASWNLDIYNSHVA